MRAIAAIEVLKQIFRAEFAQIDSAAPYPFVKMSLLTHCHIGAALGEIAANLRIRSRIIR